MSEKTNKQQVLRTGYMGMSRARPANEIATSNFYTSFNFRFTTKGLVQIPRKKVIQTAQPSS